MWTRVSWFPVALLLTRCYGQAYENNLPLGHPAIRYFDSSLDDPVTRLAKSVESGLTKLDFEEGAPQGLLDLLRRMDINPDSQALVFSKTSFQASKISPRSPRAIYFRDDAAVAFVRGSRQLELAGLDSRQGVVFYSLDVTDPAKPVFNRSKVCLQCHQGPATSGVPGMFVSSVFPSPSGFPSPTGAIVTDHRTPLEDRWGGWIVSGTLADEHRGNAVASNPDAPDVLDRGASASLTDLSLKFDTRGYLSPLSDVVALMTFEHQTQMTNLLTRLGWEARMGERVDQRVEDVVDYMLFTNEAPLKGPVKGASTFTETFPKLGPRDHLGRSLRDFDLTRRLFHYPLSYMIYSRAFDALPVVVRERIYRRLYDALTGQSEAGDRRAILEILRDTKPDLPNYWRVAVE